MDGEDKNREQARDITYKHYKEEVSGNNWFLLLFTVIPYYGLAFAFFWFTGLWYGGKPYLIFVGVHLIVGVLAMAILDAFTLFSCGARNIFMQEEKYIIDLYYEAAQKLRESHPKVLPPLPDNFALPDMTSKGAKAPLYIVDDININAFATGYGIVISKGAINAFSPEELQGVMLHEIGHFDFPLVINFLKGFMFLGALTVAVYKYIRKYTAVEVTVKSGGSEVLTKSASIFSVMLDFLFFVPSYYFKFISFATFRMNEYRADYIAVLAGYGEELKNALNMIYQLELMRKPSFMDRLLATHPPTAKRIVEIERLLDTGHY